MLLWKELRETIPLFALALAAMVAVSFLRWQGWRPELFEAQFWVVVVFCLPFVLIFSGAGAIAGEREGRTLNFLYSRPIGFAKIFLTKYLVRLACLAFVLALLVITFDAIRPTHNLNLDQVAKGAVILFSFLVYALSLSFSLSCFSDTPAKAFVSSLMLLLATLFLVNATPFFRYAWLWRKSINDYWIEYLYFYGALSIAILAFAWALSRKKILFEYQWKHLGVAAVICFLLFVRSVSTTFWLIPYIAMNRDTDLVHLAQEPVEKILLDIADGKSGSDIVYRYLMSVHTSTFNKELLKALHHPDPRVRNTAVRLLGDRNEKFANATVAALLDDPDDSVRHSALTYLERARYKEATPKLISLLQDKNSSIRLRAARALAAVQGEDAAKYLMPLLKDPNPQVCSVALSRLCLFDYGDAQPEIVELMLNHRVDYVRRNAAGLLGQMKSRPACEALIQALADEDKQTADYAAMSLGTLGCEDAVQPLVQLVSQDPLRHIPAITAISNIGSPEAENALKELFSKHETPVAVKAQIAFVLAKAGDEEAHKFLREQADRFLKKEPSIFKTHGVLMLAEMKDYLAVPMLIASLDDRAQRYRYGQALTELTGKHYGWDKKRWQKWWDKNKSELLPSTSKPEMGGD